MGQTYRILLVDDEQKVLDAYMDILARTEDIGIKELRNMASALFADENDVKEFEKTTNHTIFTGNVIAENIKLRLDTAQQGEEAVSMMKDALEEDDPYLVAVLDMRMPPGINGFETAQQLIELDPNIEICFITAYSDTPFEAIAKTLGAGRFLLLRKPVNTQELTQTIQFLGEHGYKCHKDR